MIFRYFNTFKVSSYYRDHGVLGLDGFSGLTEFKFDGVWNSVSKEEFLAFATRNPTLEIIDINVDQNQEANNILLKKTNLQIVRLRCSRRSNRQLSNCPGLRQHKLHSPLGQCKRRMTFSWFRHQQNIKYIWIQCDLKHSVQKLLDFLPLLKNLKILHLDDAEGFKKEDFFKILEISPSLEVRLYISLNTSITKLTFRCSDYREASLLRRISGFPSWTLTLEIG